MIIVEGPDGAGKSGLVRKLSERFGLPVSPKFVDSIDYEGSSADLFHRACKDVLRQGHEVSRTLSIYDRHPLISEYVYGPIVRKCLPSDAWSSPSAREMVRTLAHISIVVWCRPPTTALIRSVSTERDMSGVVDNIATIGAAYDSVSILWPSLRRVTYDFTKPAELTNVFGAVQMYIAEYRKGAHTL